MKKKGLCFSKLATLITKKRPDEDQTFFRNQENEIIFLETRIEQIQQQLMPGTEPTE